MPQAPVAARTLPRVHVGPPSNNRAVWLPPDASVQGQWARQQDPSGLAPVQPPLRVTVTVLPWAPWPSVSEGTS